MPTKLKYCNKKQPILIFAPYKFVSCLDTPLHEPKRLFLNILAKVFWFFRNFTCSEKFGTQKLGDGYFKLRLNGSEGFNQIFGIGIFKKIAAKIELS